MTCDLHTTLSGAVLNSWSMAGCFRSLLPKTCAFTKLVSVYLSFMSSNVNLLGKTMATWLEQALPVIGNRLVWGKWVIPWVPFQNNLGFHKSETNFLWPCWETLLQKCFGFVGKGSRFNRPMFERATSTSERWQLLRSEQLLVRAWILNASTW